jgi:hypothetical protein
MRLLVTIVILTLFINCSAQFQFNKSKLSKQVVQVVAKIEKVNELMGNAVYSAGERPQQYDNFCELQKAATKEELEKLTNHSNEVVRCYAFWALSYNNSAKLFSIVINHINDTATVKTQFGCISSRENVGDFFINIITPNYVDLNSKKLSDVQYEELDSILIYTPNLLHAKNKAISNAKLTENFYTRVRELVIKENNQSALIALAKYKRENDIPLILNSKNENEPNEGFYFTYLAISEFPHSSFLPLLRKSLYETLDHTHYSTEWSALYGAIASYKNDTALQLLKIPFTEVKHQYIRQYHINFIFGAIQSFYSSIYDELLWKIWEKEKEINTDVFRILYQKNPQRAFELTKQTIQNNDDFDVLNTTTYNDDGNTQVSLLEIMLDTIIFQDKSIAIKLLNKGLRESNVHQFSVFADKSFKLKDSSFINSFFIRIKREDNPHIYLKATEILIAYNDKNINKQIIETSHKNLNLKKGWGGESFTKLLKENNIR